MDVNRGLELDGTYLDNSIGSFKDAKNIVLSKGGAGSESEPGFDYSAHVDGSIIGILEIPDRTVLFSVLTIGGIDYSEIGIFKDDVYTVVLRTQYLNFNSSNPIRGQYTFNYLGELIIAWCDGTETTSNEAKILNLDNLPFSINGSYELITPSQIIHVNLFAETYNIAVDLHSVNDGGGSLKSGVYYVAVANKTKDGTITEFSNPSNPIVIIEDGLSNAYNDTKGCKSGIRTNKSFIVTLSNLSTNYTKLVVAVIYKENQNLFCRITDQIEYSSTTKSISISNYDALFDYDINDVLINNAVYPKFEDLSSNRNRLLISNLRGLEGLNEVNEVGQEIANDIQVKWTVATDELDSISEVNNETFKNPKYIFYNKAFRHDEIYALYLGARSKKGGLIGCWHIPGRLVSPGDNDTMIGHDLNSLNPGSIKRFQVEDTSGLDGTMGYWENQNEKYHSSFPDFGGQNVRHHKMPSLNKVLESQDPSYFNDPTPTPITFNYGATQAVYTDGSKTASGFGVKYVEFELFKPLRNGQFSDIMIFSANRRNAKYTAINDHVFKININAAIRIKSLTTDDTRFEIRIARYTEAGVRINSVDLCNFQLIENTDNGGSYVNHSLTDESIDVYLEKGQYIVFHISARVYGTSEEVVIDSLICDFSPIPKSLTNAYLNPSDAIHPNLNYINFTTVNTIPNGVIADHEIGGVVQEKVKYTATTAQAIKIKVDSLIRLKHVSGDATKFSLFFRQYNSSGVDISPGSMGNIFPFNFYIDFKNDDGTGIYSEHKIDYRGITAYMNPGDYIVIFGTATKYSESGDIHVVSFNCNIVDETNKKLHDKNYKYSDNLDFEVTPGSGVETNLRRHVLEYTNPIPSPLVTGTFSSFIAKDRNLGHQDYVSADNIKYTAGNNQTLFLNIDFVVSLYRPSGGHSTMMFLNINKYDSFGTFITNIHRNYIEETRYDVNHVHQSNEYLDGITLLSSEFITIECAFIMENVGGTTNIHKFDVHFSPTPFEQANDYIGEYKEIQEVVVTEPSYNAYMSAELIKKNIILGLEISNVNIPAGLNDTIDGWEIFYAKRDITNSTIVAQSALIPDEWYNDQGIMENTPLRFHAFDLMLTKMNIAVCDYISVEGIINRRSSEDGGLYDFTNIMNNELDNRILIPLHTGDYAKSYLPVDNASVDNETREGALILYINSNSLNHVTSNKIALCNLCNYQTDVYLGFENQKLASTGLIKKNTDTSGDAFGGDTFFNRYAFRLTKDVVDESSGVRTKYHRVLYLFTESSNNAELRMTGDLEEHIFYPYKSISELQDIYVEFDNFINTESGIGYNYDFTSLNDLLNPYINKITDTFTTKFPHRVAFSLPQRSESLQFGWRVFKPNSYIDVDSEKGDIIGIYSFGAMLYIQLRYTLLLAFPKEVISGLNQSAYLKPEDIFDREPQEMVTSKNGYIGSESKFAGAVTTHGYTVVDSKKRSVFFIGEKPMEISAIKAKNWFYDNMLPLSTYNPFIGTGVFISFDDFHKRFILIYKGVSSAFTLSFSISNLYWYSFHQYSPDFWFRLNNDTYYIKNYGSTNNRIFKSNIKAHTGVYLYDGLFANETPVPSSLDILINPEQEVSKLIQNIYWQSVVKEGNRVVYDDTVNTVMVYNENQCTGLLDVNVARMWYDTEHGMYINDTWYFNEVDDAVVDDTLPILDSDLNPISNNVSKNLKDWFDISKFICKFVVIRLIYNNTNNRYMLLRSVGATMLKDNR